MKCFFYCLSLLLVCTIQANATPLVDSLRHVATKQVGEEKLETLWSIVLQTELSERESAIDHLEDEAIKQDNNLYRAIAYEHRVIHCWFFGSSDSIVFFSEKGLDILSKVDKKHISTERNADVFNSVNYGFNQYLVKYYIGLDQLYFALNVIDQMLEKNKAEKNNAVEADAYFLMGMVRSVLFESEEGLKSVEKSLQLSSQRKPEKFTLMQELYKQLEKYDLLLQLTDSLESYIEHATYSVDYLKVPTYFNSAYAYIQLDSLPKAREYVDKASKLLFQNMDSVSPYILEADYHIANNDNVKALQELDKALANSINYPPVNVFATQRKKAIVLRKLGRSDEAYDLLKEVSDKEQDSFKIRSSAIASELETLHRVDNLKSDLLLKDSQLHSFRLLLGSSILVILLVIVVAVVVWRGNKKLRERNRDLYKRHIKLEEQNREIETIKRQTDLADADDIIMNKLDCYLEESKAFLDSEITRDSLAMQIGTNRQYLVAAIKEKRSQTFNEYIYMWRLKHAYNLIIHNKNIPISEIFLESGFSSQSVFNREFKKSYGMTPSELRMAAEEEEKSKI